MKELPTNFINIFVFLILVAMVFSFTWLSVHFNKTIKDEPVEETIELKYSKKGLYLYPRFEILVSNSKQPSTVSKEQFESIHVGDTISGYMKDDGTFVTEREILFERVLGIPYGMPVMIFFYLLLFTWGGGLLKGTRFVKNNHTRKIVLQRMLRIGSYTILTLYILFGMILIVLTATNIYHKMNKWNQTEVEATVLGGDFNETRYRGDSYTTYELFLQYRDLEGEEHITKKAVTNTTYNKYDIGDNIPLVYRNSNLYDTFIVTESANEVWPAFFNLYTFFIFFYLVSLFLMLRAWL